MSWKGSMRYKDSWQEDITAVFAYNFHSKYMENILKYKFSKNWFKNV